MLLAISVALGSAAVFAVANSLQHWAAGSIVNNGLSTLQLLRRLCRKPDWVLGACLGGVAFALHAVALRLGSVGVVQPVMLVGVVLAVLLRSAMDGRAPSGRILGAVSLTVASLSIYLWVGGIRERDFDLQTSPIWVVALAVGSASLLVTVGAKLHNRNLHALVLGLTAGLLMGTSAGLLKALVSAEHLGGAALLNWMPLGVALLGLAGTALNQRAYQMAAISLSMPALNVASVLAGTAFGVFVFSELPTLTLMAATVQVISLGLAGTGLWLTMRCTTQRHGCGGLKQDQIRASAGVE